MTVFGGLKLVNVVKEYRIGHGRDGATVRAVDGVTLSVGVGETVGIVGESGSGKSTLGRLAVGLESMTSGVITLDDVAWPPLRGRDARAARRHVQLVFQDPSASLNPRMRIGRAVGEPLRRFGAATAAEAQVRTVELMGEVGLGADLYSRYPHELSGGQQQRVAIARALAASPRMVVLDEPTSALDVSVQAVLLNMLRDLKTHRQLGMVFISHDLTVTAYLADRIAVMYLGEIVELGPTATVYGAPRHPYTSALLGTKAGMQPSVPRSGRIRLSGEIPSAVAPPPGCRLAGRCPLAVERCHHERQALRVVGADHVAACWRVAAGEVDLDSLSATAHGRAISKAKPG